MDGGFASGTDVLAALAMGAKAVLVGRAYAYGLGAAGEAGVTKAFEIIRPDGAQYASPWTSIHRGARRNLPRGQSISVTGGRPVGAVLPLVLCFGVHFLLDGTFFALLAKTPGAASCAPQRAWRGWRFKMLRGSFRPEARTGHGNLRQATT